MSSTHTYYNSDIFYTHIYLKLEQLLLEFCKYYKMESKIDMKIILDINPGHFIILNTLYDKYTELSCLNK